jgi:AAA+ ATPase superfamily predicted ATPase
MTKIRFDNPFKPGAGHIPPYLAGREKEHQEMGELLAQNIVLKNLILTGLRGIGKTVLLDSFRAMALKKGWLWTGNDLSESSCITEENLATRILADISLSVSFIEIGETSTRAMGFMGEEIKTKHRIDFPFLVNVFQKTPGLISDKLKTTLELAWSIISKKAIGINGIVFAYDEAQNLADHAANSQYPLSLLLEVFQSLQRKNIPFLLVLTGLPTLFPKLVETRTYAERMFHIMFLNQLSKQNAKEAIERPMEKNSVKFPSAAIDIIIQISGGYPYFLQFICKEVYDIWALSLSKGQPAPSIATNDLLRKLDSDFFDGRWANTTDKQREILIIISHLDGCENEFTGQEIVEYSKQHSEKPISASHVNQILSALLNAGLVYKNRHGKYSLAVPLLAQFIKRQIKTE